MKETKPPRWVDRFLIWYCNPDLLEEIQGDAHELYNERVRNEGRRMANLKYVFDVIRFCRWSNIRQEDHDYRPGYFEILWNLNLKMSLRHAKKNKLIFGVKVAGLAICLSFTLALTAFVLNELTYDEFHPLHDRLYRIGSKVESQGVLNNYAISPLPLGPTLVDEVPEVEAYTRFMYEEKPFFRVGDNIHSKVVTLAADSNFLKLFDFGLLQGTRDALNAPDKIVLTESTARRFFGDADPIGQLVNYGRTAIEVAAVIPDVPANSHLNFDALISWDTFKRYDEWGNFNAYTYIVLREGAEIEPTSKKIAATAQEFIALIAKDYQVKYDPNIQKVTDLHLSAPMEEDIIVRRQGNTIVIMIVVIFLFIGMGFINYLNLGLAELSTGMKRLGILRVFGGVTADTGKVATSDAVLTLILVLPLTFLLTWQGVSLAESILSIRIERSTFTHPIFLFTGGGFLLLLLLSTKLNSWVLSTSSEIVNSLKGTVVITKRRIPIREYLVAAHLAFSMIMISLILIIADQFRFIETADKGFDDSDVMVITLPGSDFKRAEVLATDMRRIAGVQQVEWSSYYPAGQVETKDLFEIEQNGATKKRIVNYLHCSPGYLDLLKVKIKSGRNFDEESFTDVDAAYLINEEAAKQFGWKDPLGKKINGPLGTDNRQGEVVGLVKDFNFASMHSRIEPLIIFMSDEDWGVHYLYLKVERQQAAQLIGVIDESFKKVYPDPPLEWDLLDARYRSLYAQDEQLKNVFQVGLVISIIVSCLGIFSISALVMALRTKEMGIRKVAGANPNQLFRLHVSTFTRFLFVAIIVACPAVYYLSSTWLNNFAYHIGLGFTYFVVPAVAALFIVVVMSAYHGVKSSMVNPVEILKGE